MAAAPERLDSRDAISRTYWGQMCPNFTSCNTADAQGKTCATCGAELQGFVAGHVECSACGETRFYCDPESAKLPGRPDLRCFACDAPMSY